MVKQQIDIEVFSIDNDSFLPGNKCETGTQLHDEGLQFSQDSGLKILFLVGIFQAKKIEKIRITEYQIGSDKIFPT
jgi:hypothetical protein